MSVITFLVEDNATIRESLISAMQDLADIEVVAFAETEAEAKTWLKLNPDILDLAVVDLLLREGSGLGVLKHLRAARPHLPVVILTNYATAIIRERSFAAGATAVFDKSTELEDFFEFCQTLRS